MDIRHASRGFVVPALFLACLSCLQPGIDPVFLTLISSAHDISPGLHGWIVTATQAGMAVGSLAAWQFGFRLPARLLVVAALTALAASAATVHVEQETALLGLRFGYGLAMGFLYTQAMSNAAAQRPNGAYGAVFLLQLLLSTAAALLLPAVSSLIGAKAALATLCLVPFAALAITLAPAPRVSILPQGKGPVPFRSPWADAPATPASDLRTRVAALALALATLFFIGATMMVWSFTGTIALEAGIEEAVVGRAVAAGSIAGALTALAVMRERPIVPPPLSGALAAVTLLCPILVTRAGGDGAFVIGIILFNIGSTAIIVRCSGLASAASADALFHRFVSCTHPLGMTLGPLAAAMSASAFGREGLLFATIVIACAGSAMLLAGQLLRRDKSGDAARKPLPVRRHSPLQALRKRSRVSSAALGQEDFAPAKK